jgi:hypothetical protein
MTQARFLNYATFSVLMISTVLGFHALWGILFLYWTLPNFYSGHAFLLSDVTRDDDPLLFWLIQIAWVVLGLMMIATDFFPAWSAQ